MNSSSISPTILELDGPTAVIRREITAADLDTEGYVRGDRDDNGDGTLSERRDVEEIYELIERWQSEPWSGEVRPA